MRGKTMQAAVLRGHGGPEQLEVRDDWPVPRPAPGEVLVAVGAAGINNTDLWTREGAYGDPETPEKRIGWRGEPLRFPRVQGLDAAGRIVEVGDGVEAGRVGTRVLVNFVDYDPAHETLLDARLVGSERDGGFAQFVAVPERNAVAVDSALSDAELASFPCAYLTALHMLNRARLCAGERILVTGASGGVGSALVQLARARGARVTAVVSAGKEATAAEIGAEAVLTRAADGHIDGLAACTGFEVAADLAGGAMFPGLLEALRPGGRYVTAGAIAGARVELDLRTLYLHHLEAIGSSIGTHEEFAELVSSIERGEIAPLVAKTYPLSEIHAAQAAFRDKRFFGKLVLIPPAAH